VLLALCWAWPAVSLPCPPIGYKGIVFHQSGAVIFFPVIDLHLKSDRNIPIERSCVFFLFFLFQVSYFVVESRYFVRLDPGFRKNLDKKLNTLLDSMGIP
jgi:hypothetical protein